MHRLHRPLPSAPRSLHEDAWAPVVWLQLRMKRLAEAAVAEALGLPLELHPEGYRELVEEDFAASVRSRPELPAEEIDRIASYFAPPQYEALEDIEQAMVGMLPPYGNLLIEVMKASALVSLISLRDLLQQAQNLRQLRVAETVNIYTATLIIYFAILAAGVARDYFLRYRARQEETSLLRTQLVEARLEALRMQLNPHFLFNTLHAVSSLVEHDPRGVLESERLGSQQVGHRLQPTALTMPVPAAVYARGGQDPGGPTSAGDRIPARLPGDSADQVPGSTRGDRGH